MGLYRCPTNIHVVTVRCGINLGVAGDLGETLQVCWSCTMDSLLAPPEMCNSQGYTYQWARFEDQLFRPGRECRGEWGDTKPERVGLLQTFTTYMQVMVG